MLFFQFACVLTMVEEAKNKGWYEIGRGIEMVSNWELQMAVAYSSSVQ